MRLRGEKGCTCVKRPCVYEGCNDSYFLKTQVSVCFFVFYLNVAIVEHNQSRVVNVQNGVFT